jgi:hypothetical protein
MKKLILILAILIASCNTKEIPQCYKVSYENGIEVSREIWEGEQKDTLIDLYIKSWFENYGEYSIKRQIVYETYVECD